MSIFEAIAAVPVVAPVMVVGAALFCGATWLGSYVKRRFYLDTFPVAVGLLVAFLLIASPQLLAALNGGNELPWERPPVNAVTVLQLRLLAQFVGGVFAWIAIEYFDRRW